MTENIEKQKLNIDSDEYLLLVSRIHSAFDGLRKELNKYPSAHCCYFLDMAYQSFINNVKDDLKH